MLLLKQADSKHCAGAFITTAGHVPKVSKFRKVLCSVSGASVGSVRVTVFDSERFSVGLAALSGEVLNHRHRAVRC